MSKTQYTPKVFILLLNWNNINETLECLESLKKIEYSDFEIIIVDNGSQDNSFEKLSQFKESNNQFHIKILKNSENLGFGGGNNTGIDYAYRNNADYVLILNNDTVVAPNFLDKLIDVSKSDSKIGLTTPSIYFTPQSNKAVVGQAPPATGTGQVDSPDLLWFGGRNRFNWLYMDKAVKIELFKKEKPQGLLPTKIEFATGACMLIKREVLEKIRESVLANKGEAAKAVGQSWFYAPYFLYFEDADLSFAIKRAGYNLVWVPDSSIWHKVSATTLPKIGPHKMNYYNNRNILLLSHRFGPFWVKYFYMHIWALFKYFKQLIKFLFPKKFDLELARIIKQGIGDYYRGKFGKY